MLIYASCPSFFFHSFFFCVKEQTTNGKVPLVEEKKRGAGIPGTFQYMVISRFLYRKKRDGILGPPISREEEMKDF